MDVDPSTIPLPMPPPPPPPPQQQQQQQIPRADLGHTGSMHPDRQARLAAETAAANRQQHPQQQQQQAPGASRQQRRRHSSKAGRAQTYAQWAAGGPAGEILSVLGFALDDKPKVDAEGGKEAAFQAFFAWCTEGDMEQKPLSNWEQKWQQGAPDAAVLPNWVQLWIRAKYEESSYGSDTEAGSTSSARSRSRSRGRRGRRGRPHSRCTPPPQRRPSAAGAADDVDIGRGPGRAPAQQQQPAQPSCPQQQGTLLRTGRMSRPPDPDRMYGGQGHA